MRFGALLLGLALSFSCQAHTLIGRFDLDHPAEVTALQRMGFTIFHHELDTRVDLLLNQDDLLLLQDLGYSPIHLKPFDKNHSFDIDPEYHTYEELTAELQTLAAAYPSICRLDSIGRAQQFPRTIWCMKISDQPQEEEDELALLYVGQHHACEVMGMETVTYMINHLLENYGSDPQVTEWVDNYEIFLVPMFNPDGYYAVTADIMECWRKNARDVNNNGIYYEFVSDTSWWADHEGVDLNRNYDWYWTAWPYPMQAIYPGEAPFSEAETQAMRNLGLDQHFVTGMSFHSYGEVVMFPWNPMYLICPDQDVYDVMGAELAQSFISDTGGVYDTYQAMGWLGMCMNWFYGELGSMNFLVEVNELGTMIPPGYEIEERAQRYYDGAKYLLNRLSGSGVTGHIIDAVTGQPVYARVEITDRISPSVTPRYNEPLYGRYTRLLNPGTYEVMAVADGYDSAFVEVAIGNDLLMQDIELQPLSPIELNLTYHSGSPVPPGGGNVTFDVYLENGGAIPLDFDAWIDLEYEGGAPVTVVLRSFTNYQPGWSVNRPNMYFPVPASYPGGSYELQGRCGSHPDQVWVEDGFPFVKEGAIATDFMLTIPADLPDYFGAEEEIISVQPTTPFLHRVYPNPFNPSTVLSYKMQVAGSVNLTVYDIAGRKVMELVDGWRDAGVHEVTFDASGLASGIYFYHLTTGDFTGVGKMVLMK